jgi:dTDP-4-amino-4,6-dideoxygalactose transaminase
MEPYNSLFPSTAARLPLTESVLQRVLLLPSGTAVSAEDISRICNIIKFAVSHGEEIKQQMSCVMS